MRTREVFPWLCAIVLCSAGPSAASATNVIGFATLKRDFFFPDMRPGRLPVVARGAVLPCAAMTRSGCHVLCRDANGALRFGFVKSRDFWGRATVRAWVSDASMPSNTVIVNLPVRVEPGGVLLERDRTYPVTGEASDRYVVRYAFGEFRTLFDIAKRDIVFRLPPPPETDPAKLREKNLQAALDSLLQEQATLTQRLTETEEANTRVIEILTRTGESALENKDLAARVAMTRAMYEVLTAFVPDGDVARAVGADGLEKAISEQGALSAELTRSQLGLASLEALQKKLALAEQNGERLKDESNKARAGLEGLLAFFASEDLTEDKRAFTEILGQVRTDNVATARSLKLGQSKAETLTNLVQLVDAALAENVSAKEALVAVLTKIEALRKKLKEYEEVLQKAEAPPAAEAIPPTAPPVEPVTPPAIKPPDEALPPPDGVLPPAPPRPKTTVPDRPPKGKGEIPTEEEIPIILDGIK